jgi:hypothetical protein
VIEELDAYIRKLGAMRGLLFNGDAAGLEQLLHLARNARDEWAKRKIPNDAGNG